MTDYLSEFTLFTELPQETLEQINQNITWIEYTDQEALWEQGDLAEEVFFIVRGGTIGMNIGRDGQMFILVMWEQGTLIGHTACITDMPRSETMVANNTTIAGKIKKDTFLKIFNQSPQLSKYLMKHMAYDLRSKILSSSAREILGAKEVVAFDLLTRHTQYQSLKLSPPLQKHWAALLGINRETLSRALSKMTHAGIIHSTKGHIEIADLDALKKIGTF